MRLVALTCVLALGAAACGAGTGPTSPPTSLEPGPTSTMPVPEPLPGPQLVKADLDRLTATDVTEDELATLVEGNTRFALDFYRAVSDSLNTFLSPYSAAEALTMTYAGAAGETKEEMASVLGVGVPDDRRHQARNELYLRLTEPVEASEGEPEPFTLRSVNSLWGQAGYEFVPAFLELLARDYDAGMNVVDFMSDPEGSRQAINEEVATETEERIPELIPQGVIDTLTRLVLVNAVYFKAGWLFPFDPEATVDGPFLTRDERTVTTPMMHQNIRAPYFQGDGYQAARLSYAGPASMLIVMPEAFEGFDLTPERLTEIRNGLADHLVDLTMPRFTFRSPLPLKDVLIGLGMETAFVPPPGPGTADFTGITPPPPVLYVQDVIHEAFVATDEIGTEAAAATGVMIGATSAPPPATLTLDRPFLFLIQHDPTGEILFIGHVGEPLQAEG